MIWAALLLAPVAFQVRAEPPRLDVAVAARELEQRDGEIVWVRGWLDERCHRLGCLLLARPRTSGGVNGPRLSIGSNAAVDPVLMRARGQEVVIEGMLSGACRREICTDRAPELQPIRVVRISGRDIEAR